MPFIDVDFTTDPRYVPGYSPKFRSHKKRFGAAVFGDSFEIIPESQWRELANESEKAGGGMENLITRIMNQGNEGSCVSNACAQAYEVLQAVLAGKDRVVPVSAMSLYKQIGSSPNSGAMVEDGIDRMNDTGFLPLDTPENKARFPMTFPHTGFRTPYPSDWKTLAAKFAGIEGFWCNNKNEMFSAL